MLASTCTICFTAIAKHLAEVGLPVPMIVFFRSLFGLVFLGPWLMRAGVTGLANRREFEVLLERQLASAKEQDKRHVLLYLDLDQFKVINDTCGHVAGDELLRHGNPMQHDVLVCRDVPAARDTDNRGCIALARAVATLRTGGAHESLGGAWPAGAHRQ